MEILIRLQRLHRRTLIGGIKWRRTCKSASIYEFPHGTAAEPHGIQPTPRTGEVPQRLKRTLEVLMLVDHDAFSVVPVPYRPCRAVRIRSLYWHETKISPGPHVSMIRVADKLVDVVCNPTCRHAVQRVAHEVNCKSKHPRIAHEFPHARQKQRLAIVF